MFYSDRNRRRERRRHGCLFSLLRLVFYCVLALAIYAAGKTMLIDGGNTHILLLGIDYDASGTSRSDTMLIVSVSPAGKVHLTSILRDTWVEIPGHGYNKINTAYHYGGEELALETVNKAFGLNIKQYAAISVRGMPVLLDTIGGIELSLTKDEARETNRNLAAQRALLAKTGVDLSELTEYGDNVHLTAAQALSNSRIRSIGNDYARTGRQRKVMNAVLDKLRGIRNPYTFYNFISTGMRCLHTNADWPQVIMLGVFAAARDEVSELRLPAEGAYDSGYFDGRWSIRPDLEANRRIFREFLAE